jgi:hypothetical protein
LVPRGEDIVRDDAGDGYSSSPEASNLRTILASRGYLGAPSGLSAPATLIKDDDILDLSNVYPKLFVRMHDPATNSDLQGRSPDFDDLAQDVNQRIRRYAAAYRELQALTDVFRAYLAAISVSKGHPLVCAKIGSIPLLTSEKTSAPLPAFHPTELGVTVATYVYSSGGQPKRLIAETSSFNGGISIRGKSFYDANLQIGRSTPVIFNVQQGLRLSADKAEWDDGSERRYIALTLDGDDLLGEVDGARRAQPASTEEVLRLQQQVEHVIQIKKEQAATERARSLQIEHLKVSQYIEEQQKVADQRLSKVFGPPINEMTARMALPYAIMSLDAYRATAGDISATKIKRVADWESVFHDAGYTESQIRLIKESGFYAAVYVKDRGEVTIAYRGLQQLGGSVVGLGAMDIELKAAADLAWLVRETWRNESLSLTGHALGGALAAFAGEQAAISKVITFNAFLAPTFTHGAKPDQVSIGWVTRGLNPNQARN